MECRTELCGRTGLTSGADELVFFFFFFFSDLVVRNAVLSYLAVTMGTLSLPALHHIIRATSDMVFCQ